MTSPNSPAEGPSGALVLPLCRYCDRLPDCAHICDTCQDTARSEHLAACDDDGEYER